MLEVALTRSPEDRRRYDLDDLGSVRKQQGFGWERAELLTRDGVALEVRMGGRTKSGDTAEAVDAAGWIVGRYEHRLFSKGGTIHWRIKGYELKRAGLGRKRYHLERDGQHLMSVRMRFAYRRTPAYVVVEDPEIDPGLVLFVTWILQSLNSDTGPVVGGG